MEGQFDHKLEASDLTGLNRTRSKLVSLMFWNKEDVTVSTYALTLLTRLVSNVAIQATGLMSIPTRNGRNGNRCFEPE